MTRNASRRRGPVRAPKVRAGRSVFARHADILEAAARGRLSFVTFMELDCPACGLEGVAMPIQATRGRKPKFYLVTCSGNRRVDVEETPVQLEATA